MQLWVEGDDNEIELTFRQIAGRVEQSSALAAVSPFSPTRADRSQSHGEPPLAMPQDAANGDLR
ncbi:MAG: hypothetical protein II007_00420 [Gammaproteobacteria bacterium]|nr:hypothetical protein [Gammaproteobacteria bacterium]